MHIVSYRGPSQAGGVSKLIQHGLKGESKTKWWHINRNLLQVRENKQAKTSASISAEVVDGHYKYANEFLWPLMHERFDLVQYDKRAHDAYVSMNLALAVNLKAEMSDSEHVFTNDYQFAILPAFLKNRPAKLTHFWHIPWPTTCLQSMAEPLIQIAQGILHNDRVGFHTQQYVQNFCNFVEEFIPEAKVHYVEGAVIVQSATQFTELISNPAQIDYHRWNRLGRRSVAPGHDVPYILSVDRADYSKGILERLHAIQLFYAQNPEQLGKIQFVFLCQKTRTGLSAFDQYWQECRELYESITRNLAFADWEPIRWIEDPLEMEELASWYAHAKAMLINARVDGLNLTAKEFIASTVNPHAALVLSKGTGAWHELKEHVLTIDGHQSEHIAKALSVLVATSNDQHSTNLRHSKRILRSCSLDSWWKNLNKECSSNALPTRNLLENSA